MSAPIPAPSQAVVKKLAQQLGIIPQREAGQNFLVDPSVAQRVIKIADLQSTDTVLEIGPGFGWLTQQLASQTQRVVAVELEKRFIPWLRSHLPSTVEVVHGNILETDLHNQLSDGQFVVVSFLPYSITAKILRQLLTQTPRPKQITLVIQKEVAERITATAGKHSKLSVMVQRYGQPELLAIIKPEVFWPAPAVDSAIIRIRVKLEQVFEHDESFWRLVRIGFASRRKTMINNLLNGYRVSRSEAQEWITKAKISEKARPQNLSIDQWESLASIIDSAAKSTE